MQTLVVALEQLAALLPIIAIHPAVGLRVPMLIAHCKHTQTVEVAAFEQYPEHLEGTRKQTTGTELVFLTMLSLRLGCVIQHLLLRTVRMPLPRFAKIPRIA